jgi:regulation of enolase protein 1 (concanavalin A-like superfamily)
LTITGQRATGALNLRTTDRKGPTVWCQVAVVNGSGKPVHSAPGRCLLAAGGHEADDRTFWGEFVDPDGDCGAEAADGTLTFKVPGTLHDLNIDIGKNNAPRAVQAVEGDFVARVKVSGSFDPGPVRTGPKSVPYNGGGLIAWLDGGSYIRLERAAMYRNGRVVGFLAFESREHGTRSGVHNKGGLDPRQDLWLRLERHGGVISGFMSSDGQEWQELEPFDVEWPARLLVGVGAVNSCGDAMEVRFEQYRLTRPPGGR